MPKTQKTKHHIIWAVEELADDDLDLWPGDTVHVATWGNTFRWTGLNKPERIK